MFQTWLDDNKVGRGKKDGDVTFAGYKVPHPLRNEMLLRVGIFDGKQETARLAVAEAAQSCAEMFRTWAAGWVGTAEEVGLMTLGKARKPWDAHAEAKAAALAAAAAATKPKPKARG